MARNLRSTALTDKFLESSSPEPDVQILARDALVALWTKLYASPPPPRLCQTFLRRFLAFELQAHTSGALPQSARTRLAHIAAGKTSATKPVLKTGGRYLREWNGVTHIVDVTDKGFLYKGQTYQSLSAIARAITGAHWSGPRFFGSPEGQPESGKPRRRPQ